MKKTVSLLLAAIMLLACIMIPVGAADTAVKATSTPTVIPVEWHYGYVASGTHSSTPHKLVQSSTTSTYRYSDVITIAEKGTTVSFYDQTGHASANAYIISTWVKKDSEWVLDEKGVNISGLSSSNVAVKGTIQTIDSKGGCTYAYTTWKDNETIRLTYCCTGNSTDPEVTVVKKGAAPTINKVCSLKFGTDGVVSGIIWQSGYVGSAENVNGNVNRIRVDSGNYTYSELLLIPKKGTEISFVDTASPFAINSAYVISSWKYDEFTGNCVIDEEGPNYHGNTGIAAAEGNGKKYTYVTYKDNELLRLCYQSAASGGVVPGNTPTVKWKESGEPTFVPENAGTELKVTWQKNYAVSVPHSEKTGVIAKTNYALTDIVTIPKAGTRITWSDTGLLADYQVCVISSWKKSGSNWVWDEEGANLIGSDTTGSVATIKSVSSATYSYVTSKNNENIRICVNVSGQSEMPKIYYSENAGQGTWQKVESNVYAGNPEKPFGLFTGMPVVGAEKVTGLKWHWGYIGSASHTSVPNQIKAGGNTYIYSDTITVPKKGTTVYFYDDTNSDAAGNLYASINAWVVSVWKKSGSNWVIDTSKDNRNGCEVEQHFYGKLKQYSYTTTEDNQTLRLCVLASTSDANVAPRPYSVFMSVKDDMKPAGNAGALNAASYTNTNGKKINYKIWLPEGYNAKYNGSVVFSIGADQSVASALIAEKTKAVVVEFDGTTADAELLIEDIMETYSVCSYYMYLTGSEQVHKDCPDTFANYVKNAGSNAAEAAKKLLSVGPAHYNILEGITMYAMGDSYFGGTILGEVGTWVNRLGRKYAMDYVNYGIGGSTVSDFVTNKNPMVKRFTGMANGDADVILLEGGRNDRTALVPIGTNDSHDSKTFLGALNIMIDSFLKKYPNAVIVLVTPWYNTGKTSAGNTNVTYANAMRDLAKYRNDKRVVCLYAADTKATGVNMDDASFRAKYSSTPTDVSHLNDAGMKLVLPYMEKFIAEALASLRGVDPQDPADTTSVTTDTNPIGTESTPDGTDTDPTGTESTPDGTDTDPTGTESTPDGTDTDPTGTESTPDGTDTDPTGTESTPDGTDTDPTGTESTPDGTDTTAVSGDDSSAAGSDTAVDGTEENDDKGCGSVVVGGAAAVAVILCGAVIFRKKED